MVNEEFEGRAVIVTGAASGLGRATALAFTAAGAKVAAADVNQAGLDETLKLAGDRAGQIRAFPCDLVDPRACAALVEQSRAAFGRLDALCCVAGLLHLAKAETVTLEQWDRIYAVNVRAPFLLFQAALPCLIANEGTVVNVVSASAFVGHAYLAPYASSKGALVALTKSLAVEFAKSPLRINAVAPGPMKTPMASSGMSQTAKGLDLSLLARAAGLRPMAEPEDITDVILYLASPRNRTVHGTTFIADQGVTA